MVRLLCDQNFNRDIVRGLLLKRPGIDLTRVQEVGLQRADDPALLAWAAQQDRIVLTHDIQTMPGFAYARVAAGQPMPGVFVVDDWVSVGRVIDDLILIDEGSEHAEWAGRVEYLPM